MCEDCNSPEARSSSTAGFPSPALKSATHSRRLLFQSAMAGIGVAVSAAAGSAINAGPLAASMLKLQGGSVGAPEIVPRSVWGGDLPVLGPLESEAPGDVRFLLIHHTVTSNSDSPNESFTTLRKIYGMHTSPEKGWSDIAYNFLIDRFGVIHEGRSGSIDSPIKGSATGGSQGFALLCCFLGDHQVEAPTEAAQSSMVALLAWLASKYDIPMSEGSTATFVSRGSNRWPAGKTVTTPTIGGHRDMSSTACPGDAAYVLLDARFRPEVAAIVGGVATDAAAEPPATTPETVPPTTVPPETSSSVAPPPTEAPTTTQESVPPTTADQSELRAQALAVERNASAPSGASTNSKLILAGGVIAVAAGLGVTTSAMVRDRRSVADAAASSSSESAPPDEGESLESTPIKY
jgi:hypothetical protein